MQKVVFSPLNTFLSCTLFFTFTGCSEESRDNAIEKKSSAIEKETSKSSLKEKLDTTPVHVKKKNFKELVIPAVEKTYSELDAQYNEIKSLVDSNTTDPKIDLLMKKYSAKDTEQLLRRLKPHPKSIAVAQAAMESAWGTSRFTKVANNLFGVWSFSKSEPRVAASETRGNKTIYVKKYDSISESVKDYYMVISKGQAYREFRELNMKTDNPYKLVTKLHRYSEKGDDYGKELASMIRFNKFYKLDNFKGTNIKKDTNTIEDINAKEDNNISEINTIDTNVTVDNNITDVNITSINATDINATDTNTTN